MPETLLRVNDLHVAYGNIKALHGIDLEINNGEVVTLIGGNGSGKSTFLKALSGLLKPSFGAIYFQGENISGLEPHKITQRGIVQIPEGRRIFPLLSVQENLRMGAFFRRDHARINGDIDRVFHMFPILKERRVQMGGTLSGGEQQMLAFGRALMSRPKLLALDEPSMGLAPIIVGKVFQFIRDINKDGVTVLLVEQNAQGALSVAQRGYVMETGSITMHDAAAKLLNDDRVKQCYLGVQENFI